MTSQDEITRTADRLKDAFGAAADVMTTADSPIWHGATDVITAGDGPVRFGGPRIGRNRKWLIPVTAAASVVVIALVTVLVGHQAWNAATGSSLAPMSVFGDVGKTQLVHVPAPDPAVLNSPGARAAESRVVKILGSAPECGRTIEGSGFVYAPQHVITAAHVVAGVTQGQTVTTPGGATYRAKVVFYDPQVDIAVLDVPGLNLAPLRFSTNPGPDAVVAGYPEDHSLTAVAARIGQMLQAVGTGIYGTGQVDRQVYQIRGVVVMPGTSGGPLLSPGGTVDGVVFAVAAGVPDTAFVLTAADAQADARAGASATAPVSTHGCLSR